VLVLVNKNTSDSLLPSPPVAEITLFSIVMLSPAVKVSCFLAKPVPNAVVVA
jgi:hypothetical protein